MKLHLICFLMSSKIKHHFVFFILFYFQHALLPFPEVVDFYRNSKFNSATNTKWSCECVCVCPLSLHHADHL